MVIRFSKSVEIVSPMCKRIILILLSLLMVKTVSALNMESASYQIKYGNVNVGAENMTKTGSYKLSTTLGQLAAGEFNSTGYTIKAGFQYWHAIVPFTFSIAKTNIDLGSLLPNTPSTDFTTLSVSFGAAGQYQVTAIEEGTLQTTTGNVIPDTSCDNNDCDETTATVWNSSSIYGFGYKMANEDIPAIFTSCGATCYRRFPDRTTLPTAESPAVVMSSANVTVDLASKPKDITHTSTITFKANVSALQQTGSYKTIINFVATPSY